MLAENKVIVRRFFEEAINKGNMVMVEELMAQNFIEHGSAPGQPSGIDGFKQFIAMISTAFPDLQVTVEDMISEEDKVVVRLTVRGTHKGKLMGTIPPTGKQAVWTGIDILRVVNGKIVERWSERDLLGMMEQLGILPAPGQS
jgi:steroid delta-isomerase-like uncharacterized protein